VLGLTYWLKSQLFKTDPLTLKQGKQPLIPKPDPVLGNLSLGIDGGVFRLLPVYDMCSMGFAPRAGEVLAYDFTPPDITAANLPETSMHQVKIMAHDFWHRVANDDRISDDFKAFLSHGNPIEIE